MDFQHEQWIQSLNWRYATKRFDTTKKVSSPDWRVLEETLRLSPSSYGLQPWKFLIVQNPEIRAKLKVASWNQAQVTDCSHYVVFTTLKRVTPEYIQKFVEKTASVRGQTAAELAGFQKMLIADLVNGPRSKTIDAWSQRQAYIAMGNLMNAAALMAIDSCPLEGLDPRAYDEILSLTTTDYAAICAVAIGYRHPDDKYAKIPKVRFDSKDVIEWIL